jgi:2'-5' RNA ligase
MKIRSFISLDLPLSLKHELSGLAKLIAGQDKRQKIRWLPPENYHLTLVFLGDVESVKISALQFALERKLESTKAVPLTISAITPFSFSRPRIAAVIVEHTTELLRMQSDVAKCVSKCGITPERRRFAPHVTLGRLKPHAGKTVDFKVRNILLSGFAESVTLFQSELTPDRAIHTALAEIPLKALPE